MSFLKGNAASIPGHLSLLTNAEDRSLLSAIAMETRGITQPRSPAAGQVRGPPRARADARQPRARLTSADRPMVAPRSQRPRDSLTGDAFGSLEHVIVFAGELHARTNPEQRQNKQQPRLCTEDVFKAKLSAAGVWRRHTSANIKLPT